MRVLVLLSSALLLGACTNTVRSQTPWFGPADAAGAPPLRDGVWAAVNPDCRFNADRPLEQWPACAQGRVVRGGEQLNLNAFHSTDRHGRRGRSGYDWSNEAFILAAEEPRIHQRVCGEPRGQRAETEEPAENAVAIDIRDEAVSRLVYCYAGLRADVLDAEDRIVAFTTWPIWCGPFPQGAEGESGPNVTDAPFPGLTVVGEHCVADDLAALRAAATASETLDTPDEPARSLWLARFRWIRGGWR